MLNSEISKLCILWLLKRGVHNGYISGGKALIEFFNKVNNAGGNTVKSSACEIGGLDNKILTPEESVMLLDLGAVVYSDVDGGSYRIISSRKEPNMYLVENTR